MTTMTAPIQATCKFAARNVSTKNGDRSNAVFTLPDSSEVTIWKDANDPSLFAIKKGDTVPLVPSGKSYKLWQQETPAQGTQQPTEPPSRERIEAYIMSSSRLFRECHNAAVVAMADTGITDSDAVAIALQLHKQAVQKFNL